MKDIIHSDGTLYSVYPCTEYLTFGYWIYLVPQYKPKDVLILGYAGGTVAGLIKLIYGNIPITGVDIKSNEDIYNVNFIKADAKKYIKTCKKFDTVVVDVFNSNSPCKFIFSKNFVKDIKKIANYLIIHCYEDSDMSVYKDLRLIKILTLDKSRFYYYMINRVANLPIR